MYALLRNMIVATVILPLTFSIAYAQGGQGGAHQMPLKGMLKQLALTADQQTEIKKIMQSSRSEMKQNANKGSFHRAKMVIIKADKFDENQASALIDSMQSMKKTKTMNRIQMVHEIYHSLSREQQAKMNLLFEQHYQKQQNRGKGKNK
ncbi:Spy/CpxP family protein refolding chaperone [Psychromonas hadalis]|uniref:Spy/CpxP family protein refolding chaperone n=1 Tax=Psychromonas hadalis TaxID=211669 RepID=UPI0003B3A43B|nr:Spy/CpxP family protein refolding chaperone [Psychromonas hadalis]